MVGADTLAAWPFRDGAQIDRRVQRWGQGWAAERTRLDPDGWVSARDAAELASVQVRRIAAWRRMGRLRGRRVGSTWEYRVRDVLALRPRE